MREKFEMPKEYSHQGFTVPERTLYSLDMYVRYGIETGGFLKAVLTNDLFGAMARADDENLRNLPAITALIYNKLPAGSWGNEKRMWDWMRMRRSDPWKPEEKGE